MLLYDGAPKDIVITISLIEHDSGDLDEYKRRIADALAKAAGAGLDSIGVPAEATAASTGWMGDLTWGLTNVLFGWLGADDDAYNPYGFRITRKEMLADIANKRASAAGTPVRYAVPFKTRHLQRIDMNFDYNIEPVIVAGKDQGGDLGKYAFYFKVETIPGEEIL